MQSKQRRYLQSVSGKKEIMGKIDEGYIKFNCNWVDQNVEFKKEEIAEAIKYRNLLYNIGLIGVLDNDIGFGNLSYREKDSNQIIITGSQTGGIEKISLNDFTKVTAYNLEKNSCNCIGKIKASSETLSHVVIYENQVVNAVIHIHNKKMWEYCMEKLPSTPIYAEFGTVEIANEIKSIVANTSAEEGIFAMGGHEDGVIAYGKNLEKAYDKIISYFRR